MQVLPSKPLRGFIKHYLYIESNTKGIKKFRLFSDGNNGLVFSFKNRIFTGHTNLIYPDYLPNSFIYGQIDSFKDIFCDGESSLLIVVFQPYGLNHFLKIPANELVDEIIDLTTLFGSSGSELTTQLFESPNINERIKRIENFLIKTLIKTDEPIHPLLSAAVDYIIKHNGNINQKRLVHHLGYDQRYIERKFIERIGILPKKFSSIVQLHTYLKFLRSGKVLGSINEAGYYDQSHLIRNFKKITGVTPLQYKLKFDPLAVNLLEYPTPGYLYP